MEFENFKLAEIRVACRHFAPETRGDQGIAKYGKKEELIELLRQKGVMAVEVQEFLSGAKTAVAAEENAAAAVVPIAGVTPAAPKFQKPASAGELNDLELLLEILRRNFKGGCDMAEVENLINTKLAELKSELVRVIEVKQPGDLPNKAVGACHKLTEQIAAVANCGIHQMLVGPAGSGKTTCVEKVSEILGLDFFPMSVGPQTTKSDLLGFIDAAGNYHTTVLREAFEKGGMLLLDELDAANAGVWTVINSLLANGYCSFPDKNIVCHPDFRCIATTTFGLSGRFYTVDPFAIVSFDYDEDLERAIAGNDSWVEKVQSYRRRVRERELPVTISLRASISGAKLLASGMDETLVEELVIWKGISPDLKQELQ